MDNLKKIQIGTKIVVCGAAILSPGLSIIGRVTGDRLMKGIGDICNIPVSMLMAYVFLRGAKEGSIADIIYKSWNEYFGKENA